MINHSIEELLGYSNNAKIMMEVFGGSSNVILTDNPEFTQEDFSKIFPVFVISDEEDSGVPVAVYNLFKAMADKSIKFDRFHSNWKYLMCLFIAHFLVLYIRTQQGDPGSQSALSGSLPFGVASSKSVDGLSISYDFLGATEDFSGYGTWKLTTYGQQLITLTKIYGHAGMWVNGR